MRPSARRRCALCGRPAKLGEQFIYSRFTRSHYCASVDACDARVRRLRKVT